MRHIAWVGFLAILVLAGCFRPATAGYAGEDLGALITNVVQHADAGDDGYFDPLLRGHEAGETAHAIEMIRASGMLTNYMSRFQTNSAATLRLGYCDPCRGCHFQIDLFKEDQTWRLDRIWFCR